MKNSNHNHQVGVGVAVLIRNHEGRYLFGLRNGNHCPDTWSIPGGKIDLGEYPRATARREAMEETGLSVGRIRMYDKFPYANTLFESGIQYVTLYFTAEYLGGEPRIMEPLKCKEWRWVDSEHLPLPLFPALTDEFIATLEPLTKIVIGHDGRCSCNAGSFCPLGRKGSMERCTRSELRIAGVPIKEIGS